MLLPAAALALTPLHVQGGRLVDDAGQATVLRGCNLGNWLLIEPWMLALHQPEIKDHYSLVQTLEHRFDQERAEALMDVYHANWIGDREFEIVKSFGFNLVRVPFYHGLLANEAEPFTLRPDAFQWLDRAVELGEKHGVYVILDMHGAPGGQSVDMPSGRVGENRLWTDEECQKRFVWMWQRIAERYADRPAVVAYDLVNEPFGDFNRDVRPDLLKLMDRAYRGIREIDKHKLLFVPATLRGLGSYRPPAEYGWQNVGYTDHWYPGLFGNGPPTLETHQRFLTQAIPAKAAFVESLDAPFLVGEFNVVFDTAGQPFFMRRWYDTFAEHGWLATMWSLRLTHPQGGVHPNNWYLVANAEPFEVPDLQTASYEQIEEAFRELGTMRLAVDEELRTALAAKTAPAGPPRTATDATPIRLSKNATADAIDGWSGSDIAGYPAGGEVKRPDGAIVVYGGGGDIWSVADEFHYLHRPATGDFSYRSWLTEFDAFKEYAKAGWMVRADLEPDAAHVLVHAFPNGVIRVAWRGEKGGVTKERTLTIGQWPAGLGIERAGDALIAHYVDAEGRWQNETLDFTVELGDSPRVGMVVMSHDDTVLASAAFVDAAGDRPPSMANAKTSENLLVNGSFEIASSDTSTDRARNWNHWGHWLNRESGWTPTREGDCLLGYHHWRIEQADSSGWYQDIKDLRPGVRYTFSVWSMRDVPAADKYGPQSVELRIEGIDGEKTWQVASCTYKASDLAANGDWSLLHVTGTIPTATARVLIIVDPSRQLPRDAALKFDAASLTAVERVVTHACRN